jgi:UDP-glucose 4-epimerase
MRVLITGAGGTLGTALAPLLHSAGHDLVLTDVVPIQSDHQYVAADLRRPEELRGAMAGVDIVVHAAAIHGIHLRDHSPRQFYELNLTGTFNLWEAAVAEGVRGFVFSSTMGVYGRSREPRSSDEVVSVHEDLPLRPTDIYGYTKAAGEAMCRYYVEAHAIPAVALRFGMFVPEPFFRYGIRLLYGGVNAADAARAVSAAVRALVDRQIPWDAFNVQSLVPFGPDEGQVLRQDPLRVLDRHYLGAVQLLRERGVERLQPIDSYFPMDRIAERLGFRPQHNFGEWLEELSQRPDQRSPHGRPWP